MLTRGTHRSSNDGGKVVRSLPPQAVAGDCPDFSLARKNVPPIRSLLDEAADWTALPLEAEGDFSRRYSRAESSAEAMVTVAAKPKRKALTFRLEPDGYLRLHAASNELGRSCQDILFVAMNRYLEYLGYREALGDTE
jgi:hypothetical protein